MLTWIADDQSDPIDERIESFFDFPPEYFPIQSKWRDLKKWTLNVKKKNASWEFYIRAVARFNVNCIFFFNKVCGLTLIKAVKAVREHQNSLGLMACTRFTGKVHLSSQPTLIYFAGGLEAITDASMNHNGGGKKFSLSKQWRHVDDPPVPPTPSLHPHPHSPVCNCRQTCTSVHCNKK